MALAFRWADPFGPVCLPILAPKSLFNFSGGVPGPSLAHDENAKGVPRPSLAPNPHFLSSLGRLRERSRRKQESSKYIRFYTLYLQWYIPWPLQGDPPGAKKKTKPSLLEPPGTHKARRHASQGALRDPQGAKPIVFLNGQSPSFEKTVFFDVFKGKTSKILPLAPLAASKKTLFNVTVVSEQKAHCLRVNV